MPDIQVTLYIFPETAFEFEETVSGTLTLSGSIVESISRVRSFPLPDIPHFGWPFRRGTDGFVVVVEQDSPEHVDAEAQLVIRTPLGWIDELQEFGWKFPEFGRIPIDTGPVEDALRKWGHPLGSPDATEYADSVQAAVRFIDIIESARET